MNFANHEWLWIGLLISGLVTWLVVRQLNLNKKILAHLFPKPEHLTEMSNHCWTRRWTKRLLILSAILLLFGALARPQWGHTWQELPSRGTDILIALDVSKSMLAQDVKPDRLSRAKLMIQDMLTQLSGERVGLIAFAGTAFLQCPPTADYEIVSEYLEVFDPSLIPLGGTNIGSAIQVASRSLENSENKVLVLISDGEDLSESVKSSVELAKSQKITIHTIGLGSTEGALLPITDESGGVSFIMDENNQPVRSIMDEKTLKLIAQTTGGTYRKLTPPHNPLLEIVQKLKETNSAEENKSKLKRVPIEQYPWLLILAITFLVTEVFISERRKSMIAMLTLLFLCYQPSDSLAFFGNGIDQFKQSQFDQATESFERKIKKNPKDYLSRYHLGTSLYRLEEYDRAVKEFEEALQTPDLKLQQKIYYNRGNALYRLGEKHENKDQRIARWKKSLESFEASIKLDPKDEDAQFNAEFVRKKLQEEQQKQEQNQQNQNDKNDSQDKSDQPQQQDSTESQPDQPTPTPQPQQSSPSPTPSPQPSPSPAPQNAGSMSREEAQALLDALKDLEKIPTPTQAPQRPQDRTLRDW